MSYIQRVFHDRLRLEAGVLFLLLMIAGSLAFMEEGDTKGFIVVLTLIGVSALLIVLPKPDFTEKIPKPALICAGILAAAAYLYVIPKRMFVRSELVISDMSALYEQAWGLNICLIVCCIFILLLLTQRISAAFGITGILCLFFALVNFYVVRFRGSAFSAGDFKAIGTAAMVMKNYSYVLNGEMWKTICYYLFFIILGFRIQVPAKGVWYHLAVSTAAIVGIVCCVFFYRAPERWEATGMDGNGTLWNSEKPFGSYLYLWMTKDAAGMKKDAAYSDNRLSEIAEDAIAGYVDKSSGVKPHIIMIMNEAWSDPRSLGILETTEELMPYYDGLCKEQNCINGEIYVNIQGGLTADTEFEALTGDSIAFLNVAAVPYEMQVNHKIASLATVLSEQGYSTSAMHPNMPASWHRGDAYEHLGFDNTVFIDDFHVDYEYVGTYLSDSCNYKEIIYQYENRKSDNPWFMFDVTIQNHSPYWAQTEACVFATRFGSTEVSEENYGTYRELNTYLTLLNSTDKALAELVEYFRKVDEPVIICMFGDHQPLLSDWFYDSMFEGQKMVAEERKAAQFTTPYFVWANYDADFTEYGDISASYLGAVVCREAGLELPAYYKFLLKAAKEVGPFNRYTMDSLQEEPLLTDYRVLMYNHLMIQDYRKDIFCISK